MRLEHPSYTLYYLYFKLARADARRSTYFTQNEGPAVLGGQHFTLSMQCCAISADRMKWRTRTVLASYDIDYVRAIQSRSGFVRRLEEV